RIVLDVRYRALGAGWRALGVHRAALFETLHGAVIASDIKVVYAAAIIGLDRSGKRPVLIASSGRLGEFDLVVDALGANSPLAAGACARTVLPYGALWANIPWPENGPPPPDALEQRYDRARRM